MNRVTTFKISSYWVMDKRLQYTREQWQNVLIGLSLAKAKTELTGLDIKINVVMLNGAPITAKQCNGKCINVETTDFRTGKMTEKATIIRVVSVD